MMNVILDHSLDQLTSGNTKPQLIKELDIHAISVMQLTPTHLALDNIKSQHMKELNINVISVVSYHLLEEVASGPSCI